MGKQDTTVQISISSVDGDLVVSERAVSQIESEPVRIAQALRAALAKVERAYRLAGTE